MGACLVYAVCALIVNFLSHLLRRRNAVYPRYVVSPRVAGRRVGVDQLLVRPALRCPVSVLCCVVLCCVVLRCVTLRCVVLRCVVLYVLFIAMSLYSCASELLHFWILHFIFRN